MKTKFFFLLAALLLNVCAFAQSENTTPLKGDVNNDGTVDVADINAVIEIMKNGGGTGEETKYYWYVGTTVPTDPTNAEQNIGLNKWTLLGSTLPTSDIEVAKEDPEYGRHIWYIAAPSSAGFVLYNATNVGSDERSWNKSTFNVGSVEYTLWTCKEQSYQAVEYLHFEGNTKYYWYIGPKKPTVSTNPTLELAHYDNFVYWHKIWNELNTYNSTNMLFDGVTSPIYLNWEYSTFYIALPVGIGIYDENGNNIISEYTLESSNIIIAGEKYNVYSGFASQFTHRLY